MADLQDLQDELGEWSDTEFGEGRTPVGNVYHLLEEVKELQDDPYNPMSWADVIILVLNGSRLAGHNTQDLEMAARAKFNIIRTWDWDAPDEHGVTKHKKIEGEI